MSGQDDRYPTIYKWVLNVPLITPNKWYIAINFGTRDIGLSMDVDRIMDDVYCGKMRLDADCKYI